MAAKRNLPKYQLNVVKYLLNEICHFHLRPLLGHVSLHLRVCVINNSQEHVLYRNKEKQYYSMSEHIFKNQNKMYLFHADPPTHHKNKENEEDKGCKVDRSNNWMSLLNF